MWLIGPPFYQCCPSERIRCLPACAANQFVVFLPLVLSLPLFDSPRGLRLQGGEPPPWKEMLSHFVGLVLIYETIFYVSHRILHRPGMYKRFHKKHHTTWGSVRCNGMNSDIACMRLHCTAASKLLVLLRSASLANTPPRWTSS